MSFSGHERDQIKAALEAMLSSDGFSNSRQMQNFLRFIVSNTLEGNAETIKGYTIGVDALGKPPTFDPSSDPSVRVMAGRMRMAIEAYNREEAPADLPMIELPKGTYVPEFTFPDTSVVATEKENASGWFTNRQNLVFAGLGCLGLLAIVLSSISLYFQTRQALSGEVMPEPDMLLSEHARLPVIAYTFEYDANGIPDWITPTLAESRSIVAFSRFNEYRAIPVALTQDNATLSDYEVKILFSKSVEPDELDTFVTLLQSRSNQIVWSNRFTFPKPENDSVASNFSQVETIVAGLLSPYGIIYGDIVSREFPPPRLNCIRQIYDYFSNETLGSYSTGLACAREALASEQASSSMYAMLAFLYVEAYRRNIEGVNDMPLQEARKLATRAIELNERNARAFQARFAVEKTSGNSQLAIKAAQRAIELNPFDRDIIGDFAAYLTSIGELEQATEPLRRATELTPAAPAWLQFYQYLHADLTGDFLTADSVLQTISRDDSPLLAIARVLAFERNENEEYLSRAISTLRNTEAGFLDDPENAFLRRGFSPTLARDLGARISRTKASQKYADLQQVIAN